MLDVVLIAALGTISIVLKNELFFKIKPAIIEAATIIFLLVLVFLPDRFLLDYFGRMLPSGTAINPVAIGTMKTMLLWMCVYIAFHIAAVLYTAHYSSRKIWALVSGPGFYFLFIPVFLILIYKRMQLRRKKNSVLL